MSYFIPVVTDNVNSIGVGRGSTVDTKRDTTSNSVRVSPNNLRVVTSFHTEVEWLDLILGVELDLIIPSFDSLSEIESFKVNRG